MSLTSYLCLVFAIIVIAGIAIYFYKSRSSADVDTYVPSLPSGPIYKFSRNGVLVCGTAAQISQLSDLNLHFVEKQIKAAENKGFPYKTFNGWFIEKV